MNWAYASIIQAFVVSLVLILIWIGIYKITSGRSTEGGRNMVLFVACYLIGVIAVLGIWGIIAYRKQVQRGEIQEE